MRIDMTPTKFEAIDVDVNDLIFKVEMFDAHCASVEIKVPVSLALWDEIAPKIREALEQMRLEE